MTEQPDQNQPVSNTVPASATVTGANQPPPWVNVAPKENKPADEPKVVEVETKVSEPIFKKLIPLVGIIIVGLLIYLLITKVILPIIKKGGEGSGSGKSGEAITLTYWGLWEPENVMSGVIAEYKKTHPNITVQYQQQSHKDYRERLQSALARGDGPDIFRFHNTWVAMLKKDLAAAPQDVAQSLNMTGVFYPIAASNLQNSGQLLGVPLEFDGLVLYYNTKIFETAGKKPPATWDELRKTALELTIKDSTGRIEVAGVALGTTNNVDHFSDILGLMMLQNGADLAKPTGSLAEDALKFYTFFVTNDKVWDQNMAVSTYAFATEKVAMFFAPSWRAHEIKQINPNIQYKTVPVPQLADTKITWASFWVEGVSTKSKQAAAAWEFLSYLASKEALIKMYTDASLIRGFGEPYPRSDMASLVANDPFVSSVISQGPDAKTWYLCSRTFDNGINDKIIKYFEDAVNAVLQKQEPSVALVTASQGVTQVLNQYGIK